jgi:hypothetical protein
MLEGTVIENSLDNPEILSDFEVIKSWEAGDWKLHRICVTEEQAHQISRHLVKGPWYVHFWKENKNDVLVVYQNKKFWIKFDDQESWKDALEHGLSLGIPEGQLNFLIEQEPA